MAEKMRESQRQPSEFLWFHKYLMDVCCHLSGGGDGRYFSSASSFKLWGCNGHCLTVLKLVLNQTHFHNLKFEIHESGSVCSRRVRRGRAGDTTRASRYGCSAQMRVYFNNASAPVCVPRQMDLNLQPTNEAATIKHRSSSKRKHFVGMTEHENQSQNDNKLPPEAQKSISIC